MNKYESGGSAVLDPAPVVPADGQERRTWHAYRLLILTLLLRPFGNLSMAWGMRHFSQVLSIHPFLYVRAMANPYVAGGILMLLLALLTRMALLSVADLSFVLPLTATGYILSTVLGKVFLGEDVSYGRWAGTLLIFAGIVLVSTTSTRSNPDAGRARPKGVS